MTECRPTQRESPRNEYPDTTYRDLIQKLTELRDAQDKCNISGPKRKKLAANELKAWMDFVEQRKDMLKDNPDFTIDPTTLMKLKDSFDRFRERKSARVPTEKITDVHQLFASHFRFRVPIHPKNLAQIINPFQGYMASFRPGTKFFSWTQMQQVYDIQIIASYEKTEGRSLLGEELSCLSFWLLQDEERKGYLEFEAFKELLYAFRFTNIDSQEAFEKEFEFELNKEFWWDP